VLVFSSSTTFVKSEPREVAFLLSLPGNSRHKGKAGLIA
jgi:hypothetical protein